MWDAIDEPDHVPIYVELDLTGGAAIAVATPAVPSFSADGMNELEVNAGITELRTARRRNGGISSADRPTGWPSWKGGARSSRPRKTQKHRLRTR